MNELVSRDPFIPLSALRPTCVLNKLLEGLRGCRKRKTLDFIPTMTAAVAVAAVVAAVAGQPKRRRAFLYGSVLVIPELLVNFCFD